MKEQVKIVHKNVGGGGNAFYVLGFIGAVIYFLGQAHTFWEFIIAILKAFVWPAFLAYELLKFLGI